MTKHKCTKEDIEWDGELEIFDSYAVGYYGTCSCGKRILEFHSLDNPQYFEEDEKGEFNKDINLN